MSHHDWLRMSLRSSAPPVDVPRLGWIAFGPPALNALP
jgi:hypothetical protein